MNTREGKLRQRARTLHHIRLKLQRLHSDLFWHTPADETRNLAGWRIGATRSNKQPATCDSWEACLQCSYDSCCEICLSLSLPVLIALWALIVAFSSDRDSLWCMPFPPICSSNLSVTDFGVIKQPSCSRVHFSYRALCKLFCSWLYKFLHACLNFQTLPNGALLRVI